MFLIDSHCHLDLMQTKLGITGWEETLLAMGSVPDIMIQVACHPETFAQTLPYLEDPRVYGAFGVHPHEASLYTAEVEAHLRQLLQHPKSVALGEIGLDYHYDFSPRAEQRTVFQKQLALAIELGKPIVLHTREAEEDTLEILGEFPLQGVKIHVHCFTGTQAMADKLLALPAEIYIGFTGIMTFKTGEEIRQIAANIPLDRLLTETDSPFLAPIPHRGKMAHPGMVHIILESLAQVRGLSPEAMSQIIHENTRRCYAIA